MALTRAFITRQFETDSGRVIETIEHQSAMDAILHAVEQNTQQTRSGYTPDTTAFLTEMTDDYMLEAPLTGQGQWNVY